MRNCKRFRDNFRVGKLAVLLLFGIALIRPAHAETGPMPEVCYYDHVDRAVMMPSHRYPGRKIWGVRFSPFHCGDLVLDGGGFDVEIDPKTFEVIDSYFSVL